MTVANCSTPANFYHLLRRQMKRPFRKPLVIFTPKRLLRYPKAISSLKDLYDGTFQEVIDDTINPKGVKKLVFCTGKIYYDLLEARTSLGKEQVALVRLEQLFPLHLEQLKAVIARYPKVETYVWAQEEPENMGAWSFMLQRLRLVRLEVVSRPYNSAPAPGTATRDRARQQRVIDTIFDVDAS